MSRSVAGKVVLITGAARGLGKALAQKLHGLGAKVALAGLEPEALRALAAQLGDGARAFDADVTDLASLEAVVEDAVQTFGHLDVVVANAGITQYVGTVESLEPERFERVIDVNLLGVYRTMRASRAQLTRTRGYFLAVCSTAYGFNAPLQGHYAASKAGVHALVNAFRTEMRWTGVDVGAFYPTFVSKADDQASPDGELGALLWGGNSGGAWGKVSLDDVVNGLLRAIRGRKRAVVVPRAVAPVVISPWIMQWLLERDFTDSRVETLVRLAREGALERLKR